jgi:cellulose synthase/poly-beta-1,6-N-acetylglucosamine synthase-like glycosyltransferase
MMTKVSAQLQRVIPVLGLLGLVGVMSLNVARWKAERRQTTSAEPIGSVNLPSKPSITAVVAAWNEVEHIEELIRSFRELGYPEIDLVVCAGGTDGTFERAQRLSGARVQVIQQHSGEGKQRALAKCLEYATGEIIYLTDADCLFSDDALELLLEPLISNGESVATGTSHPLPTQSDSLLAQHLWARDLAASRRNGEYINGILGRNAAIRREAIDAIGGLDFHAPTGTDYHLARRLINAGYKIRYIPSSSVPSEYPSSISEYRKKQSRWLRNLLLFGRQYNARDDIVATGTTMALGTVMTLLPLSGLILGRLAWSIWLIMLTHAALVRIRHMIIAVRHSQQPFPPIYPVAVFALTMLDFIVCALPVIDLADNKKRRAW